MCPEVLVLRIANEGGNTPKRPTERADSANYSLRPKKHVLHVSRHVLELDTSVSRQIEEKLFGTEVIDIKHAEVSQFN